MRTMFTSRSANSILPTALTWTGTGQKSLSTPASESPFFLSLTIQANTTIWMENRIGRLVDGVVYSALRYDAEAYPASRFGALDLANQKKLWEIRGSSLRTKPAVSGKFVVTVVDNIILALERQTGRVAWSEPLGEIADTKIQWSDDRWKWEHENMWSRRFAVSNNVLIVQGSKGIAARRVDNGKSLWVVKLESNTVDTDPVVFQEIVIAGSLDDCSVFAIDLKSGKELWRIKVPDCIYYHFVD